MRYDLIIRNGLCVLPWGEAATDVGIRDGRIATLDAGLRDDAAETFDATGLHVLPGLIDAHVHLRDPGDASVESIPAGTRAAVLGGIATVFDMPNTSPAITDDATLRWKQEYAASHSHTDFAFYVGATRANTPDLAEYETRAGVCAVKLFAGSSTGDLMIEDDPGIEAVMRSGRRRIAFHSEDEYRLQERRALFRPGMPYDTHRVWRDEECAFLGTRRIMALARRTNRPAHILHVSTAEELEYLRDCRDVSTVEVLVNHLTQVAPDCYERLGGLAVMNPPIRDRRHFEASWAAIRDGTVDTVSSDHAPHPLAAKRKEWPACPAGLTGVQTIVPVMLDHVNAGRLSPVPPCRPDGGGACARLQHGEQGPHRCRLRRRLHPGRHEGAAYHHQRLDRHPLRLDPVRRHGRHRLARGHHPARRAGDARRHRAPARRAAPWPGSPGEAFPPAASSRGLLVVVRRRSARHRRHRLHPAPRQPPAAEPFADRVEWPARHPRRDPRPQAYRADPWLLRLPDAVRRGARRRPARPRRERPVAAARLRPAVPQHRPRRTFRRRGAGQGDGHGALFASRAPRPAGTTPPPTPRRSSASRTASATAAATTPSSSSSFIPPAWWC